MCNFVMESNTHCTTKTINWTVKWCGVVWVGARTARVCVSVWSMHTRRAAPKTVALFLCKCSCKSVENSTYRLNLIECEWRNAIEYCGNEIIHKQCTMMMHRLHILCGRKSPLISGNVQKVCALKPKVRFVFSSRYYVYTVTHSAPTYLVDTHSY